ncbi:hypothetical protein LTR54_002877 [Friedmanniomyces endolithicus]|uniref:Uncharacterized protein n=2 Tax=Friedmanniomyces endolithicus TaxID=329885 RepID=A0AAN6FUN2_9PEZI|nr:hypothetical protein LTR82_006117 [Friedmanniomyces endolithicus]KAK0825385.1 hypothetical protein LTR73_006931 [Friedmanniomyces endolithicus]KAK0966566.1 hypothetical protein LTS01_017721 [Friedmanniomyces endolithicus]KAK1016837.1 hypothetical protein LTR54_002877 [Friedmanniomyces endolithicus]
MADSMLPHIFRPIPDLSELPQPTNREDRLRTIIANLEKHDQDVRYSMLVEARQRLKSLSADEDTEMNDGVDAQSSSSSDHRQFIASMNASYTEGSGDPCLLHGSIPTSGPSVRQAPVPVQVRVAQDAIEQMEAYDRHVKQTKDYYVKALQRQQSSRGDASPAQPGGGHLNLDPRRRPTG